jgi:hypothetical protein
MRCHFDEIATRSFEVHNTSTYDTRDVVPTHATYAVPATFQLMTMMQHMAHTLSIVPILVKGGEQSHGVHPKNNIILSPHRRLVKT